MQTLLRQENTCLLWCPDTTCQLLGSCLSPSPSDSMLLWFTCNSVRYPCVLICLPFSLPPPDSFLSVTSHSLLAYSSQIFTQMRKRAPLSSALFSSRWGFLLGWAVLCVGSTPGPSAGAGRLSECGSRVSWPASFRAFDLQGGLSTGQFGFFPV